MSSSAEGSNSQSSVVGLSCSSGGVNYNPTQTLLTYSSTTATYPSVCQKNITRTCQSNGQFDGPIISDCMQSCVMPGDGKAVAVGHVTYYTAASSPTCTPNSVECQADGQFNVTLPATAVSTCTVTGQTCSYANGSGVAVPSGNSAGATVSGYSSQTATFPKLCSNLNIPASSPSICQSSGSWSRGAPLYTSCTQSCSLNGAAVAQGIYYTASSGTAAACSPVTCQANGQFSSTIPASVTQLYSQCAVVAAPVIANFQASSTTVASGDSVVLSWTVTGAATLTIDNGVGDVSTVLQKIVKPTQNTKYTITATNPSGTVTASVSVSVGTVVVPGSSYPFKVWTSDLVAVPPSTTGMTYYVDGKNGLDSNNGTAVTSAFKTIKKALSSLASGDTVLIKGGLYREGIVISGSPTGTASKPITFGSYGDSEVILDGSTKVSGWTLVSGSVWKAPVTFNPVGVVVNDVPLKQVAQGQNGTTAPNVGLSGVTNGSGKWFSDKTNKLIYADMGSVNPATADIVVPSDVGDQQHVFLSNVSYINFIGLTIRGSGAAGFWTYNSDGDGTSASHITVQNCSFKFNGKAGVTFTNGNDNQALYNHIYQNVLTNWPRGNNGNADAGGGWPGALAWQYEIRPVARGNIVHMNGGEGIITYGDALIGGVETGSALFEQNVSYDNWSMNMYVDAQPNGIVRNNILFRHPPDKSEFIYECNDTTCPAGKSYPWQDVIEKYRTCFSISDEYGSTRNQDGIARNSNMRVYNNLLIGCRVGILDYGESVTGHGLKNAVIANNTIIVDSYLYKNASSFGISLQDNGASNSNSVIENNIIYSFNQNALLWYQGNSTPSGLTISNNLYYSLVAKPFRVGYNSTDRMVDFAGWKSALPGDDSNSKFLDPLFVDVLQFQSGGNFVYSNANLQTGSPARGFGTTLPQFNVDLLGIMRPSSGWSVGAFQ